MAQVPSNPMARRLQQNKPLPQFEQARQRAQGGLQAQGEGARQALARQFQQIGGGPSGAQIKQTRLLNENIAGQQNQALRDIDLAEASARLNQGLQLGEAQVGREFASQEAQKGRDFQRGIFDVEQGFKEKVFDTETGFRERVQDITERQAQLDEFTTLFNQALSQFEGGAGIERLQLGIQSFLDSLDSFRGSDRTNIGQFGASQPAINNQLVTTQPAPSGPIQRRRRLAPGEIDRIFSPEG